MATFVNHNLCEHCWHVRNPDREPVRVRLEEHDKCCSCGCPTYTGIFVRGESLDLSIGVCAHGAATNYEGLVP